MRVPSKKNAVNSILGVGDGSSTFAEREQTRKADDSKQNEESGKQTNRQSEEETERDQRADQQTVEPEGEKTNNRESSEATSREKAARPQRKSSHQKAQKTLGVSDLELDTEIEQTAKASYYLTPEQTKRLDDLRTALRHEANYTPREASYSRIVGLAIDRLYEEVFPT